MKKTLFSLFATLWLNVAVAQQISLANFESEKTQTIQVAPNKQLNIAIMDMIPVLTNYTFTWQTRVEVLPKLDTKSGIDPKISSPCDTLNKLLKSAKSEKTVRQILKQWPDNGCVPSVSTTHQISEDDLVQNSPFGRAFVREGETLILTIKREGNATEGIAVASWTFEFSPGSSGKWEFSYGSNFFNLMNRDDEYYLDSGRNIQKVSKDYWKSIVKPTVGAFITFYPTHRLSQRMFVGFTAGYSTNLQSNNFFVGASAVVRQNVLLHLNLGIRQVQRLKGKYSEYFKDTSLKPVPTSIEATDLIEGNYMPDFSFGISFRFKENPFATKGN